MTIRNVHERRLPAAPAATGALLDQLPSPADPLWPHDRGPAMRFDRGLRVGATGGHGPIRYMVDRYEPGSSVAFRFTGAQGLGGEHRFEVPLRCRRLPVTARARRHATGPMCSPWPVLYRPLHDVLIEDCSTEPNTLSPARRLPC